MMISTATCEDVRRSRGGCCFLLWSCQYPPLAARVLSVVVKALCAAAILCFILIPECYIITFFHLFFFYSYLILSLGRCHLFLSILLTTLVFPEVCIGARERYRVPRFNHRIARVGLPRQQDLHYDDET